jgi:hypothetical protein
MPIRLWEWLAANLDGCTQEKKESPALFALLAAPILAGSPIGVRLVRGIACFMTHNIHGILGGILIADTQSLAEVLA